MVPNADLRSLLSCLQIVEGSSTSSIKSLRETLNLPAPLKFDLVFIDHLKVSLALHEGSETGRMKLTSCLVPISAFVHQRLEDDGGRGTRWTREWRSRVKVFSRRTRLSALAAHPS